MEHLLFLLNFQSRLKWSLSSKALQNAPNYKNPRRPLKATSVVICWNEVRMSSPLLFVILHPYFCNKGNRLYSKKTFENSLRNFLKIISEENCSLKGNIMPLASGQLAVSFLSASHYSQSTTAKAPQAGEYQGRNNRSLPSKVAVVSCSSKEKNMWL